MSESLPPLPPVVRFPIQFKGQDVGSIVLDANALRRLALSDTWDHCVRLLRPPVVSIDAAAHLEVSVTTLLNAYAWLALARIAKSPDDFFDEFAQTLSTLAESRCFCSNCGCLVERKKGQTCDSPECRKNHTKAKERVRNQRRDSAAAMRQSRKRQLVESAAPLLDSFVSSNPLPADLQKLGIATGQDIVERLLADPDYLPLARWLFQSPDKEVRKTATRVRQSGRMRYRGR